VRRTAALALALGLAAAPARAAPDIAAAASLRHALPEVAAAFRDATGRDVGVSYASSGALTRQIRRGAPYGLFLAANAAYPQKLIAAGLTVGEGATYARGRLAYYVPGGSPLDAEAGLDGLTGALRAGTVRRFAIPNPKHAPYGERARQALRHAGVWDAVQPALVVGENAAQAARFAAQGPAAGGILPATLAQAPAFGAEGAHTRIAERRHAPLRHRLVTLTGAGETARRFRRFVLDGRGRAILRRHGLAVPGDGG
jgi:molybdate transport system substrate-binding protein